MNDLAQCENQREDREPCVTADEGGAQFIPSPPSQLFWRHKIGLKLKTETETKTKTETITKAEMTAGRSPKHLLPDVDAIFEDVKLDLD